MKEAVLQRVINICSAKFASESQFAKAVGINQKTINQQFRRERSISLDTILAVLSSFEDISAEWLMRGTGDMELPSASTPASSGVISSMEELEDMEDLEELEELNYSLRVLMSALEDVHQLVEMQKDKITALETELEGYKKAKAS